MIQRYVRDNVNAQAMRLDFFLDLLGHMLQQAAAAADDSVPITLLFASILKIKQSGRAVQLIIDEGCVEEILAIGRTLVEVTVNAAYLQYAGESELTRYLRFHPETDYQQVEQMRQRRGRALGSGRRPSSFMSKLGALMHGNRNAPLTAKGDPTWTTMSLMDRAQLADAASDIPVMTHLVRRCYPKGHASAHGTIGSLETHVTALTSATPPPPEQRLKEMAEALFVVNLSLMTLCVYLNTQFQLGMDESIEAAANADHTSRQSINGTAYSNSWHTVQGR